MRFAQVRKLGWSLEAISYLVAYIHYCIKTNTQFEVSEKSCNFFSRGPWAPFYEQLF
jgi:hypothetical protein